MSCYSFILCLAFFFLFFFFFNDPATTEIYTLSLHDALPICAVKLPQDLRNVGKVVKGDENSSGCGGVFAENKDRKSTRLNSSHVAISYAVFCLKKKKKKIKKD